MAAPVEAAAPQPPSEEVEAATTSPLLVPTEDQLIYGCDEDFGSALDTYSWSDDSDYETDSDDMEPVHIPVLDPATSSPVDAPANASTSNLPAADSVPKDLPQDPLELLSAVAEQASRQARLDDVTASPASQPAPDSRVPRAALLSSPPPMLSLPYDPLPAARAAADKRMAEILAEREEERREAEALRAYQREQTETEERRKAAQDVMARIKAQTASAERSAPTEAEMHSAPDVDTQRRVSTSRSCKMRCIDGRIQVFKLLYGDGRRLHAARARVRGWRRWRSSWTHWEG